MISRYLQKKLIFQLVAAVIYSQSFFYTANANVGGAVNLAKTFLNYGESRVVYLQTVKHDSTQGILARITLGKNGASSATKATDENVSPFIFVKTANGAEDQLLLPSQVYKMLSINTINAKGEVEASLSKWNTSMSLTKKELEGDLAQYGMSVRGKGKFAWNTFLKKTYQFPLETFLFFVAQGAMEYLNLLWSYENSPTAFSDLIAGQKDPIANLSFWAFMVAAGASAEPMMLAIRNPKYRSLVTYGSMGVGHLASTIVKETHMYMNRCGHFKTKDGTMAAPSISMDIRNTNDVTDCDDSFKSWVKHFFSGKQMSHFAQSLTGLVISTALSAAVDKVVKAGMKQVLSLSVLMYYGQFSLGGTWITIPKWIMHLGAHTLHLFNFVEMNALVEPIVNEVWNYPTLANRIDKLDAKITKELLDKRQNGYKDQQKADCVTNANKSQESCQQDLLYYLDDIEESFKSWNDLNLLSYKTAQSKWASNLTRYSTMYNGADSFYKILVQSIQEFHMGRFKGQGNAYVPYMKMPLFGVNQLAPDDAGNDQIELLLNQPDNAKNYQRKLIDHILNKNEVEISNPNGDKFSDYIALGTNVKRNISLRKLLDMGYQDSLVSSKDYKILSEILNGLDSKDDERIGKTIEKINNIVFLKRTPEYYSKTVVYFLSHVRKALGDPRPQNQRGMAFLKLFTLFDKNASFQNPEFFNSYVNSIKANNFAESALLQGVFGPNGQASGSVIANDKGYYAAFYPPRFSKDTNLIPLLDEKNTAQGGSYMNGVFTTKIKTQDGRVFDNAMEYLLKGNIDPELLVPGSTLENYQKWWWKNAESKFRQGWLSYEFYYNRIAVSLLHSLKSNADHAMNNPMGNAKISNGILRFMEQKLKFYLMVLGEVYRYQTTEQERKYMANSTNEKIPLYLKYQETSNSLYPARQFSSVLEFLRFNDVLDLDAYHPYLKSNIQGEANAFESRNKYPYAVNSTYKPNFQFQNKILTAYRKVESALKSIKTVPVRLENLPENISKALASDNVEQLPVSFIDKAKMKQMLDELTAAIQEANTEIKSYKHFDDTDVSYVGNSIYDNNVKLPKAKKVTLKPNQESYIDKVVSKSINGLSDVAAQLDQIALILNTASLRDFYQDGKTAASCSINVGEGNGMSTDYQLQKNLAKCK